MSATLRAKTIRLAHAKPELRPHLLAIVAAEDVEIPRALANKLPDEAIQAIQAYRDIAAQGACPRVYKKYEEMHPLAGRCRGISVGLADALNKAVGRNTARVVGGWFKNADRDYYYPKGDWVNYPPQGLSKPGEQWEEHWWVEMAGFYIDVSSDQFFPTDIGKQEAHKIVIVPKSTESYYPYRRRPLRQSKPLPPALEAFAAKIVSMKQAKGWSFSKRDKHNLYKIEMWLAKSKYLNEEQTADLLAVMRHEDVEADMTKLDDVRALLQEIA